MHARGDRRAPLPLRGSVTCPKCEAASGVTETRKVVGRARRRRRCDSCGHMWWTVELSDEDLSLPVALWKRRLKTGQ